MVEQRMARITLLM